jgi:hypothetical protein
MKTDCILQKVLESNSLIFPKGFHYEIILGGYPTDYHVTISRSLFKTSIKVYKGKRDEYFNHTPVLSAKYDINAWKQIKSKYKKQTDRYIENARKRKARHLEEAKRFFCNE